MVCQNTSVELFETDDNGVTPANIIVEGTIDGERVCLMFQPNSKGDILPASAIDGYEWSPGDPWGWEQVRDKFGEDIYETTEFAKLHDCAVSAYYEALNPDHKLPPTH